MKNKVMYIVLGIVVLLAIILFLQNKTKEQPTKINSATNPKNATYIVNGQYVTLVNGFSSSPSTNDANNQIITEYFGNEVSHDFDSDGRPDVGFILTQKNRNDAILYYFVVALNKVNGYIGSDAFFLGDRIAPQTTEMSQDSSTSNIIVVNYADRKPSDSAPTDPSVGKSTLLRFNVEAMKLEKFPKYED